MPSVKRSTQWFVRVDYPRSEVEVKVKQINQWIDLSSCLGVFHYGKSGENPHFHMIMTLKSDLQKQSFDTRIKNIFPVKGSQYCSKVWDGKSGAGSYLFHENISDIIINRGYSDSDISEFKRLNEEVQKVVAINAERGTNKSVQRIIDELEKDSDRQTIFNRVMDDIREGKMYHPGFRLPTVVDEIFLKLCSDTKWKTERDLAWYNIQEKMKW